MTNTLSATPPITRARARDDSPYRLSFLRVLRSEWIKFTTLRSTWWSIGLVALISIGLSLLMASAIGSFSDDVPQLTVAQVNAQAVQAITFSTLLTQLLAVVLGTIAVTGEYSTGMIRSTLTAVPRRIPALLAKATVIAAAMFVTSIVVFVIAALVSGPLLPTGALDLSDPESSLMPLLGAALYLAVVAVMGVGIGFIIRNGPGAIATGIGIVFVAPIIVLFFPKVDSFMWIHDLSSYLPSNVGQSLFLGSPMTGTQLDTLPAVLTLLAWAVAALIGGLAVLKTRDA